MRRPETTHRAATVILTGLGVALLGWCLRELAPSARPYAEVLGRATVYVQSDRGPVPIAPNHSISLPRPQHLAFEVHLLGQGPVEVTIALDSSQPGFGRQLLHRDTLHAPFDEGLDFVHRLGDSAPDRLLLEVNLESLSGPIWQGRYPLHLATASHRFWARETPPEP